MTRAKIEFVRNRVCSALARLDSHYILRYITVAFEDIGVSTRETPFG